MRRVAAVASLLLALALAGADAASALPLLSHHGRWLTDPQGRVVVLHGVQIDKLAPTRPYIDGWIDMSPENVRFVGAEGFDAARVSLGFSGVEPRIGTFDDAYVQRFVAFDRRLAGAGVYDLIDMMQGEYSTVVGGWGFPDWMTITDGAPNNHAPFAIGYLDNPAEEVAWDNLWSDARASDGTGLQAHYAAGLSRIAAAFVGAPGLLGFEILNEPWPGLLWATCASPLGCVPLGFDQTQLSAFYRRMIFALRAADPHHLIAYEPNLLFDYGAATQVGRLPDPDLLFAFHNYCLASAPGLSSLPDPFGTCGVEENLVFANAAARTAATGDALLMDEWGNTTNLTQVNRIAAEADAHMVGWTVWAYEDCCGSPAAIVQNAAEPPTAPGNLNVPVLTALVRPYPRLVAGTPRAWSFNPSSDTFTLSYSTAPVAGGSFPAGADTEVELPALRYPTGYAVSTTGASVRSAPDANMLALRNLPGAAAVSVTVTPARHHPASVGPFTWPAGASIAPADCPATKRETVRFRRYPRVVRVVVYVDGLRAITAHRHRVRRVTLPAGLADGTAIRVVWTTVRRARRTTRLHVHGCSLAPRAMIGVGHRR